MAHKGLADTEDRSRYNQGTRNVEHTQRFIPLKTGRNTLHRRISTHLDMKSGHHDPKNTEDNDIKRTASN